MRSRSSRRPDSRSSSILIGALIGLLLGGIAAVIGDSRIG